MPLHTITSRPELSSPVLVAALAGWVDAASVGTGAVSHIASDGEVVAFFDSDALFDYRANRPILEIVDGIPKELTWPGINVVRTSHGGRDLLALSGTEPDYRWKEFAASVLELARGFDVRELICVGAVPGALPHTRPCPVLQTASRRELLREGDNVLAGLMQVPSAAISVVDLDFSTGGIPTAGFWAHVPHYVTGPYYEGMVALVRKVAGHLDVAIPTDSLEEEARRQRAQLDELVAARPEAAAYVKNLESAAVEVESVSGEDLANEIERFLSDRNGGDSNRLDP